MAMATAQTLMLARQAQQAADSAGVDISGISTSITNVRTRGFLALCDGPDPPVERDIEDDRNDEFVPLPVEATKYQLRMCIHSGKDFPREKIFVKLVIGEGTEKMKTVTGPAATLSPNPVWEFLVDEEVDYDGKAPNVELMFFGERFFGEKKLGACALPLPSGLTDGPRRQRVKVANMPQWFLSEKLEPRVLIVWQVCKSSEGEPDLLRVAEMPVSATEKRKWNVDTRIVGLELKRPTAGSQQIRVELACVRTTGGKERRKVWKSSPGVTTQPAPKAKSDRSTGRGSLKGQAKNDLEAAELGESGATECNFARWTEDNECSWDFWETQVNLMSAVMHAKVFMVPSDAKSDVKEEGNWRLLGTWCEALPDLMDAVDETNTKLLFDAELKTAEGMRAGRLRLETDVYAGSPHRAFQGMAPSGGAVPSSGLIQHARTEMRASAKTAPRMSNMGAIFAQDAQLRIGITNLHGQSAKRQDSFYCTLLGDCLIVANESCNPYIRITMSSRGESDVKHNSAGFSVMWEDPVMVTAKSDERKARVEIWNKRWGWGADELVGEYMIYDVTPGMTHWCHCFGGAYGTSKKDESLQMIRGAIKPASTYHGSVAVNFGTRPKQHLGFVQSIADMKKPACLVVRLYRGIYLDGYADKQVNVLVQLAGCALPVRGDGSRLRNRSVLSFPGEVDSAGVLRFVPSSHTSLIDVFTQKETVRAKDVAWVERSTPSCDPPAKKGDGVPANESIVLQVAPGVTHAYLYIVALGDEDLAPQVFGRLRLQTFSDDPLQKPAHVRPTWKRMRKDVSVVDDVGNDDFAGFILGSAVLKPATAALRTKSALSRGAEESLKSQNALATVNPVADMNTAQGEGDAPPEIPHVSKEPKLPILPFEQDLVRGFNPLEKNELLPSSTKPQSVLCRPCTGETVVNVGSPGEMVHYRLLKKERSRAFCHLDVLAGRSLPAMDEDGLADPCYRIRIEDQTREPHDEDTVKSLNPTFMHRYVIPVELELDKPDGELCDNHSEPLPPVLFRLLDRDQKAAIEKAELVAKKLGILKHEKHIGSDFADHASIGTVVVKHPMILDQRGKRRKGPDVDVDSLHTAVWHAVDRPAHTQFQPESKLGIDATWKTRPRVLLAVGYSLGWRPSGAKNLKEEPKKPHRIDLRVSSEKFAKFEVEIDFLGLRNLPKRLHYPELCVTSYWEGGPVALSRDGWTYDDNPQNPNFVPHDESKFIADASQKHDIVAWRYINNLNNFISQVKPVIPIKSPELAALPSDWSTVPEAYKKAQKATGFHAAGAALANIGHNVGHMIGHTVSVFKRDSAEEEDDDEDGTVMQLEDVVGVRIAAPVYKVPVIPYMQRKTPSIQVNVRHCILDDTSILYPFLIYEVSREKVQDPQRTGILPTRPGELGGPSLVLDKDNCRLRVCYTNARGAVACVGIASIPEAKAVPDPERNTQRLDITKDDQVVGHLRVLLTQPHDQVLMPDLVIQLRNMYTFFEYGTLSAPLRSLVTDWDVASWSALSIQEYKNCQLKGVKSIKNSAVLEDAYEVFMDVFAAKSGFLSWNPDVRMGRFIQTQPLFRIAPAAERDESDDEDADGDAPVKPAGLGPPFWQTFNPMDRVCGDPRFRNIPFDKRCMPNLVVQQDPETKRRRVLPAKPQELLGYLAPYVNEADQWSTKALRKKAKQKDLRCVSHLTVPEVVSRRPPQGRKELEPNTHTFLRPLGHQIMPETDRDSRYLARLKICVPQSHVQASMLQPGLSTNLSTQDIDVATRTSPLNPNKMFDMTPEQADKLQDQCNNYMIIKFNRPGVIIWAPSEEKKEFNNPGEVLFAVRLEDGSGSVVTVSLPVLDLRFPFETGWYLRKTLASRWQSLSNRIATREMKEKKKQDKKRPQKNEGTVGALEDIAEEGVTEIKTITHVASAVGMPSKIRKKQVDSDDDAVAGGEQNPDGYSLPIAVTKNAFVCRIKKRPGTHAFDRLRTNNWYRTVLSDVFEEVRGLKEDPENDFDFVRREFLSRFMNMRQPLVTGESMDQQGMIKGHISVRRLNTEGNLEDEQMSSKASLLGGLEDSQDSKRSSVDTIVSAFTGDHRHRIGEPRPGMRPVENLWLTSVVSVNLYVLTADALKLKHAQARLRPYLKVKIKGWQEAALEGEVQSDLQAGAREASFYEHFPFFPTLPGPSTLSIQVWHKASLTGAVLEGEVQDQLIGECEVDVEDRWLVLQQRQLRAISNQDYLQQQTAPLERAKVQDALAFLDAMDKDLGGGAASSTSQGAMDKFFAANPATKNVFGCFAERFKKARKVPAKNKLADDLRAQWNLPRAGGPKDADIGRRKSDSGEVLVTPDIEVERVDGASKEHQSRPVWKAPFEPSRVAVPGTGMLITPHVAPMPSLPIEAKELYKEDEDTGATTHVGSLRFWVDLQSADENYTPTTMNCKTQTFEIRVTVWDISGISIFKDFGERNDVLVEGRLTAIANDGATQTRVEKTDTHKWAQKEATFNWRWVWRVKAPALQCQLELTMKDEDLISGADAIYEPKVLNLDHMLMLAHTNLDAGLTNLGVNQEKVVFDAWPRRETKSRREGCCCCKRVRTLPKPAPATMRVDVQIIPEKDADNDAVDIGRIGGEPKNRLTWRSALNDPGKFLRTLLGPRNTRRCIWCLIYVTLLAFCISLLVLLYLAIYTLAPFV